MAGGGGGARGSVGEEWGSLCLVVRTQYYRVCQSTAHMWGLLH